MTYEFVCPNCDVTEHIELSIYDSLKPPFCKGCGYSMRRVFDAPAIQFKGGGFYSTDNK